MRIHLSLLFLLFLHFSSFAQESDKMPLKFESNALNLCLTKDEQMIITSAAGEVALRDKDGNWYHLKPINSEALFSGHIDQGNFFNSDTGFVSGFINGGTDKYNLIYHTANRGKTWKKVDFGQSGWVDNAVHLDNGEAWLSVAGSGFAYTTDYGLTWTKLNNPEPRQRFSKIYFNTKREGIIGSLYNLLAVTNDNCQTWTFLPTPLDQKAYRKTDRESRPEFEKVAIYRDHYLVAQEGLVFYSPKSSVKWTWLPQYTDFYTDTENSALYFRTNDGAFVRSGDDFQAQHIYRLGKSYDAECRNGKLFILGTNIIHQLNPGGSGTAFTIGSTHPAEVDPNVLGFTSYHNYGHWNNRIYTQETSDDKWKHLFTLPIPVDKGSLSFVHPPTQVMYRSSNDSLYYFDTTGALKEKTNVRSMITRFAEAGISKVIFSKGSIGCFHYYDKNAVYTLSNGALLPGRLDDVPKKDRTWGEQLEGSPAEISLYETSQFLQKLPQLFDSNSRASIDDLSFSSADYEQCKRDIRAFRESVLKEKKREKGFQFNRNNLDFDRLISLVDSIPLLSPVQLEAYFTQADKNWSTTTNWVTMELVNSRNEVLSIHNSHYENPPFYFPWKVSLNGLTIKSTNMDINRFITLQYPGFLKQPNKIKLLHELVKWLY